MAADPQSTQARLRSLLRPEVRGLADQAVASGVNFLTLILVARSVSPSRFGYFALVFTLLQSVGALQLALITRPHNVLGSARRGADYARYTTSVASYQFVFALSASIVIAAGAAIARGAGAGSTLLFLVAAPTLLAWQLQEFGRRVLYTERRLGGALANDSLSYGAQAVLLVALQQGGRLTGVSALVVIAATSAAGAALAAAQLRRSFTRKVDRRAVAETWRFGRWLGAAEVAYWFESQYYVYLGAALVGPVASAALKAGQTLLGPISVYLAFFVNYLPIRFVRHAVRESAAELRLQMRIGLLSTVPVTVAYALLVGVFARPLLDAVYGSAYGHYASVVRLFALYYVLLSVSDVVVASLSARDRTRLIFAGHVSGAIGSLVLGWVLLEAFGAAGGVVGMILSIATAFGVFVSRSTPAAAERRHAAAP